MGSTSGPEAPYSYVRFRRRLDTHPEYVVQVVNVHKLVELHDNDDLAIPNAVNWPDDKFRGLQTFLDPAGIGAPEMPIVGIWDRRIALPGWWNMMRKKSYVVPAVAFTNGRHRTRMLMHWGAKQIPVETSVVNLNRLQSMCC